MVSGLVGGIHGMQMWVGGDRIPQPAYVSVWGVVEGMDGGVINSMQ